MQTVLMLQTALLFSLIRRTEFIQPLEYDVDWGGHRFPCHYCPPGTYWDGNCTPPDPSSVCLDCPAGQFQNVTNKAESCALCRPSCPFIRQVVVANCTATSDLLCECGVGYHWDPLPGLCLKHNACEPGYGVISVGMPYQNTQCRMCEAGKNFSPNASLTQICDPCSVCPHGLVQTQKCTTTNDTICGKIPPDGDGLSTGTIAGIVCGIFVALLFCCLLIWLYRRGTLKTILEKSGFPPRSDSRLEAVDSEQSERLQNGTTVHPPPDVTLDSNQTAHDSLKVKLPPSNGVDGQTETKPRTHPQDTLEVITPPTTSTAETDNKLRTPSQGFMMPNILQETSMATTDNNPSYSRRPSSELLDDLLRDLSQDLISLDWQFSIRFLIDSRHNPDTMIQQVMLDYPTNVQEQIYQLLLRWRSLENEKASLDAIVQMLKDRDKLKLASKYQNKKKCTTV